MKKIIDTPSFFIEGKRYLLDKETEVVLLSKTNNNYGKIKNVTTNKVSETSLGMLSIKY